MATPRDSRASAGARRLADLDLGALHERLLAAHGPQDDWWPAESAFERMVSAILVQNTRWENAAAAIANLREAGLMSPEVLAQADPEALAGPVRPAGFMTAKSAAVRGLAAWVRDGEPEALGDEELRAQLLALRGVGPETADVIALYRYGRRAFIADAYARRLLARLDYAVPGSYEATRRQVLPALDASALGARELGELHGLIVEEGKADAQRSQARARHSPTAAARAR